MGLFDQLNQFYQSHQVGLQAVLRDHVHRCLLEAKKEKDRLEMELEDECTFRDGWVHDEGRRRSVRPIFPELPDNPFPEKYHFVQQKEDLKRGDIYYAEKKTQSGQADTIEFGLIDINDNKRTGNFNLDYKGHLTTEDKILEVLMRNGKGLILTKKQFEALLLLKLIITEYTAPKPRTMEQSYYSSEVWEILRNNGGTRTGTAYYLTILWEMLKDDFFLEGRYVLGDKHIFQQFLLSLVASRTNPVLTKEQSHCVVMLARESQHIAFIPFLSQDDSVYLNKHTQDAWAKIFFQQLYNDFYSNKEHSFPALLQALDVEEKEAKTDEKKEGNVKRPHSRRTCLLLTKVIAEARLQKRLSVEDRHILFATNKPGKPTGETFLNLALTKLLFEAKMAPETKGEKHRGRHFAIQRIKACATLEDLKQAFLYYIDHTMITSHRHRTIDDIIGFFRSAIPFAGLSKDFYSDAEIAIRRVCREKLATFQAEAEYENVKALFDKNEKPECLVTILPVARYDR